MGKVGAFVDKLLFGEATLRDRCQKRENIFLK
jgi:hypothetical protein